MEKKSGQKSCSFDSIYKMKTVKDVPYTLPMGMSKEWYIEFYTVACHILKGKDNVRYEMGLNRLRELVNEAE